MIFNHDLIIPNKCISKDSNFSKMRVVSLLIEVWSSPWMPTKPPVLWLVNDRCTELAGTCKVNTLSHNYSEGWEILLGNYRLWQRTVLTYQIWHQEEATISSEEERHCSSCEAPTMGQVLLVFCRVHEACTHIHCTDDNTKATSYVTYLKNDRTGIPLPQPLPSTPSSLLLWVT